MASPRPEWADWLREQFDRHRTIRTNAELSRAGGEKPNGRPKIDPSSITQWLRGRRPSYELAMATAEAFGRPISEALIAAGYRMEAEHRGESVPGLDQPLSDDVEEDDEIRYQRPEGISDSEWETRKRTAQVTLRALFEEYQQ